jgi:hypothetical protein
MHWPASVQGFEFMVKSLETALQFGAFREILLATKALQM